MWKFPQKNNIRKRNDITEVVNDMGMCWDSISPLGATGDVDGSEFYGFSGDFEKIRVGGNLKSVMT